MGLPSGPVSYARFHMQLFRIERSRIRQPFKRYRNPFNLVHEYIQPYYTTHPRYTNHSMTVSQPRVYYALVHPSSHPFRGGPSVCVLAYSMGIPPFPPSIPPSVCAFPPKMPFRTIACRYNLPPSPTPTLSSSQAARIALYCLSSSSSCARRCWSL